MAALLDPQGESAGKTHFLSLCRCFAGRGHRVAALLSRMADAEDTEAQLARHGVKVAWTPALRSPSAEWLFWGWLRTLRLLAAIRRFRPDVLYVRTRTSAPFLCAAAHLMRPGLHIVSEHPGWVAYQLRVCGAPAWQQRLAAWSQSVTARYSDQVRVVADGIGTVLTRAGIDPQRIFVVGNGTDTSRFRPIPRTEAFARTGLDPSASYVGFAGLLERWQGLDILLRAAPAFLRRAPEAKLLIVGSGPEEDRLRALAADLNLTERCVFTGHVPHRDMPYYINCFSLAILFKSGLDEIAKGLYSSLKLRDYAACGVAVVASANAVDHQIVASEQAGCLVELNDEQTMASTMVQLLHEPIMRTDMSRRARSVATRQFSWEHIADRILFCIESGSAQAAGGKPEC